jgi:hypothetical protein
VALSDFTPTPEQIAAVNRARAEDARGNPVGTFDSTTRPTDDDVEVLADLAAEWVADQLGIDDVTAEFQPRAQRIAAMYAAAAVEAGAHEPRQQLIDMWTKQAETAVTALGARIREVGAGDQEGPVDDEVRPAYSFPAPCPLPEVF